MKKYFQRILSLAGQAGRKEMLGAVCLACAAGLAGTAAYWALLYAAGAFSLPKLTALASATLTVCLFLGKVCLLFCAARRLRHIGLNPWWSALLIAANFIPYGWAAAAVIILLLLVLPALNNEHPEPAAPSYLLPDALILLFAILLLSGSWWMLDTQKRKTPDAFRAMPVLENQLNAVAQTLQDYTGLAVYAPQTASLADPVVWQEEASYCGQNCWQYRAQEGGQTLRVQKVLPSILRRARRSSSGFRRLWTFRQQFFDEGNTLREVVFFDESGNSQLIRRYHPDGTYREWIFFSEDGRIKHFQAVANVPASTIVTMKEYGSSPEEFVLSQPLGGREPERTYVQRAMLIRPDGSFQRFQRNEDGSVRLGQAASLAGKPDGKKPSPKHLAAFYQSAKKLPDWLEN